MRIPFRLICCALLAPALSLAQGVLTPDDPFFSSSGSWGQKQSDQWAIQRIGFTLPGKGDSAWDIINGRDNPVVIAVIDTGLDYIHPDLVGDNIWKNQDEIAGNDKDDDNNGFVDDVIGWNFINHNNRPWDHAGHGTHVAGIIGASTGNGHGIAGINPGARIMPLKVMNFLGGGRGSAVAAAIFYAVKNGAQVINMSLGSHHVSDLELKAIRYAYDKGITVVIAAGNEGVNTDEFGMAGIPEAITVAATNEKDERTAFSNWGSGIDIAAPGVDVLSLRARRTDFAYAMGVEDYQAGAWFVGEDTQLYRASGTSFAAPLVAGVASLLKAKNSDLTPQQIKRMLLNSSRDIDQPGIDQYSGYGLLDATAALSANPEYFIKAQISGVSVTQAKGKTVLRVTGTANADKLKRAWIEIGAGERPKKWKKVSGNIKKPVQQGVLADLDVKHLKGAAQWTLKLVTEHKNGKRRENWFILNLG